MYYFCSILFSLGKRLLRNVKKSRNELTATGWPYLNDSRRPGTRYENWFTDVKFHVLFANLYNYLYVYVYANMKKINITSTRTNCRARSTCPATIPCFVKAEFMSWSGMAHGTSLSNTAWRYRESLAEKRATWRRQKWSRQRTSWEYLTENRRFMSY